MLNLAPPFHSARSKGRTNYAFSLLRYLFPHTRQRARAHLSRLRHGTLPNYRIRAQSRIFRYLANRQARTQQKKAAGKTILARLGIGRRNRAFAALRLKYAQSSEVSKMTQPGGMPAFGNLRNESVAAGNSRDEASHERGSRRRKLAAI